MLSTEYLPKHILFGWFFKPLFSDAPSRRICAAMVCRVWRGTQDKGAPGATNQALAPMSALASKFLTAWGFLFLFFQGWLRSLDPLWADAQAASVKACVKIMICHGDPGMQFEIHTKSLVRNFNHG